MAAEGMHVETEDLLVTTGGQQVIDLVCKTLIDPGDVVVAEAPTYPGAVPVFISYQADVVQIEMDEHGMRTDVLAGRARAPRPRGAGAEVHLHGPVVPQPGRRDAGAGAAARAREDRQRARAARARGQPVRPAALRGRAAADALHARRRRVRDLPRHVLQDPLPRPAAGLGGRAAPGAGEAQPRQGRRRPVLVHALAAVRRDLLRRARLARLPADPGRPLPAPARRDARGAGRALPARGVVDAAGRRPVPVGDAAGVHRHDRPAGAGAARERRVRARPRRVPRRPRRLRDAAQLLRRQRRGHPRGHPADRQGRPRAGRPVLDADRRQARSRPASENVVELRRKAG